MGKEMIKINRKNKNKNRNDNKEISKLQKKKINTHDIQKFKINGYEDRSFGSVILETTYALNSGHTKYISVGFHPNTLDSVLVIRDCILGGNILLTSADGIIFFEKLNQVFECINKACDELISFLRGQSKKYQSSIIIPILSSLSVQILFIDQRITISFEQINNKKEEISLNINEFNMLYNLSNLLKAVHIYNKNHTNHVICYFNEYKAKCHDLNVDFLTHDHFFQPLSKDEQTHNFLRLFTEIPYLCINSTLSIDPIV